MKSCDIKTILAGDSVSSSREITNRNFQSLKGCIDYALKTISETNQQTQLVFPANPQEDQEYIISYLDGEYYVTPINIENIEESGTTYWLVTGETLNIRDRKQHIVVGQMIQELGSTINIEPTGQLVVL
jgi:hypothetical protein